MFFCWLPVWYVCQHFTLRRREEEQDEEEELDKEEEEDAHWRPPRLRKNEDLEAKLPP